MRHKNDAGFTAVELLVTLFVAAAFLIAGYQLFSIVIRDGGATRAEAIASNLAYEYLREYEQTATSPCTPATPLVNQTVTAPGIVDAHVFVTISCPLNNAVEDVSKIEVIVEYNNPTKRVTYATLTNGSNTLNTVTNGLIGWWRLNNNVLTSVGEADGAIVGAAAFTTAQNTTANGAVSLNGTSQYVTVPNANTLSMGGTLTVSAWVYPTTLTGRHPIYSTRTNNTAGSFQLEVGTGSAGTNRVAVSGPATWVHESVNNVVTLNAWNHIAYTRPDNTSIGTLYVNGSAVATAASAAFTFIDNSDPKSIGFGSNGTIGIYFGGRIDDLRVYNRALSGSEVSSIFSGGGF